MTVDQVEAWAERALADKDAEIARLRAENNQLRKLAEDAGQFCVASDAEKSGMREALLAVEPVHDVNGYLVLEATGMSIAEWVEKRDAALGEEGLTVATLAMGGGEAKHLVRYGNGWWREE